MTDAGTPWTEVEFQFDPKLTVPELQFNSVALKDEIHSLCQEIKPIAWRSQPPGSLSGLSLSYDPQAPEQDWHCGSFGHPRYQIYNSKEYFQQPALDHLSNKTFKGDYLDALSFRRLLPEIEKYPALSSLLNGFAAPLVMARLRILDGNLVYPTYDDGGLHTDFPPSDCMRINVCVTTTDDFGLQYENHEPFFLQPGQHCVVNTDVKHRPWVRKRSAFSRIHLTLELTPWLDYDPVADAWSINEHCGKTHPYDLVRRGWMLKSTRRP